MFLLSSSREATLQSVELQAVLKFKIISSKKPSMLTTGGGDAQRAVRAQSRPRERGRQRALPYAGRRAIDVLSTPLDELKVNPILTAYFIYGND